MHSGSKEMADAQGALGAALVEAAWCAWPLPNLARSFWHCLGPDCSRVCLACLGLCRQAPQLAIAQLHLQMLCTGVHEQPAGEMLAKSGGFCVLPPLSTQSQGPWLKPRPSLARCDPALASQHRPQHREGGI